MTSSETIGGYVLRRAKGKGEVILATFMHQGGVNRIGWSTVHTAVVDKIAHRTELTQIEHDAKGFSLA